MPGDFHSAGGDSPEPHTASEQSQEELAGDTGSEHHLQPRGDLCSPEICRNLQKSCPLHAAPAAGLDSINPSATPEVSFWETAGFVPGCLTPGDLLLHSFSSPICKQSGTQSATGRNLSSPNPSHCNGFVHPWLDKASWRLGNAEFGF